MTSSFNEIVFNLCLHIELLFDELEQILINKSKEDDVQHLVLVHVVYQLLGVVNGDDRLGEVLRVHRLLKLLVGVSGAVAVSEYHQVLRLLKLPHELLHQVLLSFL